MLELVFVRDSFFPNLVVFHYLTYNFVVYEADIDKGFMKSQSILLELLHFVVVDTKTEAEELLLKKASRFRENGAGGGI